MCVQKTQGASQSQDWQDSQKLWVRYEYPHRGPGPWHQMTYRQAGKKCLELAETKQQIVGFPICRNPPPGDEIIHPK